MSKIAVTGSTGYLGSLIALSLERLGSEVLHVNRSVEKTREVFGEGAEYLGASSAARAVFEAFEAQSVSVVIHASTHFTKFRTLEDVDGILAANFGFAAKVFEAAKEGRIRFLNLNSFWQDRDGEHALGPYAASKEAFRRYIEVASSDPLNVENIYVPETFGPHDPRGKLVSRMVHEASSGKDFNLENPHATLDISYAPFLAKYIAELALSGASRFDRISYINFPRIPIGSVKELVYSSIAMSCPRISEIESQSLALSSHGPLETSTSAHYGELKLSDLEALIQHLKWIEAGTNE